MSFHKKLGLLQQMIDNAMTSIRSAQQIMDDLVGADSSREALELKLSNMSNRSVDHNSDDPVYEGVFDGERMITTDGDTYSVPANYASKSKLIAGDELKLTITDQGKFIYKQIGPAERKNIVGILVQEDGRYKVLGEGKAYRVLLAAVTYYKAEVGDKISLIVPAQEESEWGAIDNVVPAADLDPSELPGEVF